MFNCILLIRIYDLVLPTVLFSPNFYFCSFPLRFSSPSPNPLYNIPPPWGGGMKNYVKAWWPIKWLEILPGIWILNQNFKIDKSLRSIHRYIKIWTHFSDFCKGNFFLKININSLSWNVPIYTSPYCWEFLLNPYPNKAHYVIFICYRRNSEGGGSVRAGFNCILVALSLRVVIADILYYLPPQTQSKWCGKRRWIYYCACRCKKVPYYITKH